ncbi:unnamed protein product [Medioppia subpectinata]|uniref:Uncharacterized protein n=1 Tax=Medioppia subpectinata TaxID=1979941 RepID=A0A7R9LGR4_9ACAR|nr:unnamed protein product [Medioppia subpectinata]CAG2118696.1 unnamed protein product [Medioppia subpectinata]
MKESISESDEQIYDKMMAKFLGIGNGSPFPTADESAKALCNSPESTLSPQELSSAVRFYATFGAKMQPFFGDMNASDSYNIFRWFCNSADQGQLGQALNAKLIESKKLRDTAITSLESLDTNRLYTNKFEAMFEDKLARDSVRNVGVFYRETVDFGKSLSVVNGRANCTLIDTPAPNITYRTFLLPLIKTIDRLLKNEPVAESADVVTDRLLGPALGIGNGRPFPDTEAGAKSFCSGVFRLTEQNVSIPQNYYNTLGEKTLKAVTVIARPDGYETLRGFCGFADPVKLGRGLNINLKEAITLRDNVVNYLDNANIANTTLADVICVIRLHFLAKAPKIFADQFAQIYIQRIMNLYAEIVDAAERIAMVKPINTCTFPIGNYPGQNKYLTFYVPMLNTISRFMKGIHV